MKPRFAVLDHPANGTDPVPAAESDLTAYQIRWKEDFLTRLDACYKAKETLSKPVGKLIESGIQPKTIIAWGVEAGYSKSWVKTVVYTTLMRVQPHKVGPGGRRASPEAIEIANRAIRKYHERAPRLLLAAYRYAQKQLRKKHNPAVEKSQRGHSQAHLAMAA